tara:strand:+ start:2058 stop:2618 length:561 start_codon:yes stop_codon:yes gene_type:complete
MTKYTQFITFIIEKLKDLCEKNFNRRPHYNPSQEHYNIINELFTCKYRQFLNTKEQDYVKKYVDDCENEFIDSRYYEFMCGFRIICRSQVLDNDEGPNNGEISMFYLDKNFIEFLESIWSEEGLVFLEQLQNVYNYVNDKLLDVLKNKKEQDAKHVLYNALSKAYWNPKCEMGRRMALKRYNKLLD